jgi:hypothetical protein
MKDMGSVQIKDALALGWVGGECHGWLPWLAILFKD